MITATIQSVLIEPSLMERYRAAIWRMATTTSPTQTARHATMNVTRRTRSEVGMIVSFPKRATHPTVAPKPEMVPFVYSFAVMFTP